MIKYVYENNQRWCMEYQLYGVDTISRRHKEFYFYYKKVYPIIISHLPS